MPDQELKTYLLYNMKKYILILLFTVAGYGQTLQSPIYNKTTTNTLILKTPATVTSVNFLSTVEADGSIAKISPINLPFALDSDVIHKTGNLSETANGLKTFSDQLTFGEASGSPQELWKMPANSLLKYNNLQTIQYGFNITTLGADSFFWLNDEGVARQCLLYADGDSTIDSDVFGISGSQDSGGSWNKNFSVTQGGNVYVRSLLTLNGETASTIAGFDASKNVKSLSTATYPSLTELSYVKGVTSSLQTQLNGKQATLTNPITGTGATGQVSFWSGTSTHAGDNALVWDNTNKRLGVGVASPMFKLDVRDTNGGTFFDGTNATYNRWKSFGTLSTIAKPLLVSAQTSGTTPDIYIHTSGGVSMGNTTDPGAANLSVTGNSSSASKTITTTPTTSAGTYDFLTRNTSTGVVEKVLSSTIALDANVLHKSGNEEKTGSLTFRGIADPDYSIVLTADNVPEKMAFKNNQGTNFFTISDAGAGQGSFLIGTASAYIYGREAGPLELGSIIPFTVPNATTNAHAINRGQLNGAMIKPIRSITATTTALVTDYTILCDATSGAITLNLPAAASNTGLVLSVKKINNTANNITIDPNGAELIDLAATLSVSTYLQSVMFQSNGTGWYKIN